MKKLLLSLSLILGLQFAESHASLPDTLETYTEHKNQLQRYLNRKCSYTEQERKNFLNNAHTVHNGIPHRLVPDNEPPFLKNVMKQGALDLTRFYIGYHRNNIDERLLDSLIGLVNVLQGPGFSAVFPEGSTERRNAVVYVASSLKTVSSLPRISAKTKRKIDKCGLILGVNLFRELLSYQHPGREDENRLRWTDTYWRKIEESPSKSRYIKGVLPTKLIKLGHPINNPIEYVLDLLRAPNPQNNEGDNQGVPQGPTRAKPPSLNTRRGQDDLRRLLAEYQQLDIEQQAQEHIPAQEQAHQEGTEENILSQHPIEIDSTEEDLEATDDSQELIDLSDLLQPIPPAPLPTSLEIDISSNSKRKLETIERSLESDSLEEEEEEDEPSFNKSPERKKRRLPRSLKTPKFITKEAVKRVILKAQRKNNPIPDPSLILKKLGIDHTPETGRQASLMKYSVLDELGLIGDQSATVIKAIRGAKTVQDFFLGRNNAVSKNPHQLFEEYVLKGYNSENYSEKTFKDIVGFIQKIMVLKGEIPKPKRMVQKENFKMFFRYITHSSPQNQSFQGYLQFSNGKSTYSQPTFARYRNIYNGLYPSE